LSTTDDAGGWLRRLTYWVMRHRRHVYLSLVGALVGGVCQTIVPLAEREIVDRVSADGSADVGPWLWVMAVVAVLGFAMAYLRRYHGGRVALGVQYDLRNAMHEHLQRMDARSLEGMPTGQLVGRASSDSSLVQGLLNFFPIMSSNVLLVLLSLSVMLVLASSQISFADLGADLLVNVGNFANWVAQLVG